MIGNSRVASVKAGVWEVADGGIVYVDATGGSIDVGDVTLG